MDYVRDWPPDDETTASSSTEIVMSDRAKSQRAIYVCGFVGRRMHNQTLMAIIHELLPSYYVTVNPSRSQSWHPQRMREMMSSAEACVFLINEFTLKDLYCLLTLQCAWEMMVPLVMLRHPRMKLVISPVEEQQRMYGSDTPDLALLQDLLFIGYKQSIAYDRTQHEASVRLIKLRLNQVINQGMSNGDLESRNGMVAVNGQSGNSLKLPPIILPTTVSPAQSYMLLPTNSTSRNERSLTQRERSASTGHMLAESLDIKSGRIRNSRSANTRHKHKLAKKKSENDDTMSISSKHSDISMNELLHCTSMNLDDQKLYHETQYLVFPIKDKSQNAKLIRFPNDLANGRQEQSTLSAWGSDTSLEEEANIAPEVKGNLEIASPTSSPAPYMDPL